MSTAQERPNPFPGLRSFEPDEDHLFFGREESIDELLGRLRTQRFISVVGTSGSGKSSLVRSGVIPALHGGAMAQAGSHWRVALFRPGSSPFGRLAEALSPGLSAGGDESELADLRRAMLETTLRSSAVGLLDAVRQARLPPPDNVLIVVDQFEELFRFRRGRQGTQARNEALAFVRSLLAATRDESLPIYVILTMRSSYLGDCSEFPNLPEAINAGIYLVPRLTRDQLRRAITGPVAVGGARITPRLTRRVLNDVGDNADLLPLMQHALMRAWEEWSSAGADGEPIDLAQYQAVGGVSEALSRHADQAFEELATQRQRRIAAGVFKALTDRTADPRGVRRPCSVAEISAITEATTEEVEEVIETFRRPGRTLLMPPSAVELTPDSVIDLSHESLMRVWTRLMKWSLDEARSARFYLRLAAQAADHAAGEAGLWRRQRLPLGQAWREENRPNAAWARRYGLSFEQAIGFLDKSQRVQDAWRARQRRKAILKTTAAIGAVVLVAVLFSGWQWRKLRMEREEVARQDAVIRDNTILATAESVSDPLVAALLVAELDPAREPSGGVRTARRLASQPIPRRVVVGPSGLVQATFSPDASRIAMISTDGSARVSDIEGSGRPLTLPSGQTSWETAAFSPSGRDLFLADEGTLYRWSLDGSGELTLVGNYPLPVLAIRPGVVAAQVLGAAPDGTVSVWSGGETATGKQVVLSGHRGPVLSAAFSPDGSRVVTGSVDRTARVWKADGSGRSIVLEGHQGPVLSVRFSADGSQVVTGSVDRSVRVWRSDGAGTPIVLEGHGAAVATASFNLDGTRVVSGGTDGSANLWFADGAGSAMALHGHESSVVSAGFSADGDHLLTAAGNGAVTLWPAAPIAEPVIARGDDGVVIGAAFVAGSAVVARAGLDGSVRVTPVGATGSPIILLGHEEAVVSAAFSRDGDRVATTSLDGTARIWPLEETPAGLALRGHTGVVVAAAFDGDGSRLASGSLDGTARVWSADDGSELALLSGHEGGVFGVAFSPAGELVATAAGDGAVRLWSADGTGEAVVLTGHEKPVGSVAFSHDGTRLVSASDDGTARIWNIDGSGEPLVLREREGFLKSAVFSHDDRLIMTTASDGAVRLWTADGRGEPLRLEGSGHPVEAAAFSANDQRVLSVSQDGTSFIWRVGWPELLSLLRRATDTCLTTSQRAQYLEESAALAAAGFDACQQSAGRMPGS